MFYPCRRSSVLGPQSVVLPGSPDCLCCSAPRLPAAWLHKVLNELVQIGNGVRRSSRSPRWPLSGRADARYLVCVAEQLDLTIIYEPGEDGWVVASIPEVAGVFSQGRTRYEARTNVIDALRLMLSPEPSEAGDRREREALHLTIAA